MSEMRCQQPPSPGLGNSVSELSVASLLASPSATSFICIPLYAIALKILIFGGEKNERP